MNADGTNQTKITDTPTIERTPDWQPLPGPTVPKAKAECKKEGYKEFGFKNRGRCVAFVNRAVRTP